MIRTFTEWWWRGGWWWGWGGWGGWQGWWWRCIAMTGKAPQLCSRTLQPKALVQGHRKGEYNHIKYTTTEPWSEPAIIEDDNVEADEEVMLQHTGPTGPSRARGRPKDLHSGANIHGKDFPSCFCEVNWHSSTLDKSHKWLHRSVS